MKKIFEEFRKTFNPKHIFPSFVHSPSESPERFFSESLLQGPAHTSLWRPQFPCLQNGFREMNGVTRSCYPTSMGCGEKDGTEATLVTQGHM